MEGTIFINAAITEAIKKYLTSKEAKDGEEYSSFLVIVIRALILIYGELDIINPFRTNNESGLGGFDSNLKKYGLTSTSLQEFKDLMQQFYASEFSDSLAFKKVQKNLIEMFILKYKYAKTNDDEIVQFRNLLYFADDSNSTKLELYQKLTPDSNEIINYFDSRLYEEKHNFNFTEYRDIVLNQEAYQLAGYDIVEIMHMSDKEIANINNKVYHFFRIKDTDLNKNKRLESAISYYKKYGNAITSGNGYVDLLLLMGVVATGLMFAVILAMHFGG
jgi:hypothetical protein